MNSNGAFDRDLERWLEDEAPTSGPTGLHAAIIERSRTTRQRPGWLASLRGGAFPSPVGAIGRPLVARSVAAAVLGVLAVSAALYLIQSAPSAVGRPSATPGVSGQGPSWMTPCPVGEAAPSAPSTAAPSPGSRAVPNGPMTAGRYHIDLNLCSYPTTYQGDGGRIPGGVARVAFQVPAGWSGNGSTILKGGGTSPGGLALAPGTVNRVYIDPCHTAGAESRSDLVDPPLARHALGFANALTSSWGGSPTRPVAVGPTDVTLAGLPGRYVEVRAPSALDVATCDGGRYTLWVDERGGLRSLQPGELAHLWIVDVVGSDPQVPGGLLVIDGASFPGTSAKDLAELQSIVGSMKVELTVGP